MRLTGLLLIVVLTYLTGNAQPTDTTQVNEHLNWKLSLSYLSNAVYMGRKDSAVLPYITPAIRYVSRSGFYAEAALSLLPKKKQTRIDMAQLGVGYKSQSEDSLWTMDAYANKYFNNTSSYSVKSALKADAGLYATYNPDIISASAEIYGALSEQVDIVTSLGLFKDIALDSRDQWSISPQVIVNAGTSNFYKSYFSVKKFARRQIVNGQAIKPIVNRQPFGILDFELSASLEYEGPRFGFFLTPTYAIPVHAVTVSLDKGVSYFSEKLTNSLFVETGCYIRF